MALSLSLPCVYPIIDGGLFAPKGDLTAAVLSFAEELLLGGAQILQYRDKVHVPQQVLACARELRRLTRGRAMLIMNDRVDLALGVDADGVHLGQDDLSPAAARRILQLKEQRDGKGAVIGFSTHNLEQIRTAEALPVDYVAIGPVFATSTKTNPDPIVGLETVRAARAATRKPLVAIGGITRENCRQVRQAGADSVAVVSDLLESPRKAIEDFRRILE